MNPNKSLETTCKKIGVSSNFKSGSSPASPNPTPDRNGRSDASPQQRTEIPCLAWHVVDVCMYLTYPLFPEKKHPLPQLITTTRSPPKMLEQSCTKGPERGIWVEGRKKNRIKLWQDQAEKGEAQNKARHLPPAHSC